ncbi:MAG: cytochrome P450 [Phormidesmis sp.]
MNQPERDVLVLADGEVPPAGTASPPRQPQWSDTLAYINDPDSFCQVNLARYGPVFKSSVFGNVAVFVGSSRANQMVFNGDTRYTEIGLPPTTMAMFGEYSLFQRPDLHCQRKSALRPAFTGQMLSGYLPQMHRVIAQHLASWDTTAPMQLVPAVEAMSFDVLAPLLLGIHWAEGEAAFKGLPVSSKADLKRLYKTFFDGFYGLLKWKSPLTTFGRGYRARTRLLEFMRAVIQQRRAAPIDPKADFLAMMLVDQQENPTGVFSDALIENQCLLQLWASHYEVTGLLASWVYQLSRHPDLLERLRAEQQMVLGDQRDFSQMSIESLKQMTFLEATIKETLRTLPPSSTATRRLTQSVVLDGMLYEKGWSLIAEPRIAHSMSDYFTNPDQFAPDRFLPERNEGKRYEFIPFGGGVHACLGAQLAMVMATVFGAYFLEQLDCQLIGEANFVQFPLRKIKDGYRVQLSQRIAG